MGKLTENMIINELIKEFAVEEPADVTPLGSQFYKVEGSTYLVTTDLQADVVVNNHIKSNLADFINTEELAKKLGYSKDTIQTIKDKTTEANTLIRELADANGVTEDLVLRYRRDYSDRGPFLATYDGHELERYVKEIDEYIYMYRIA